MALGHTFRPRNFVWGLALAAFLLWAMALWQWSGPETHRRTYQETARGMLGNLLLAYDDAARQPDLPRWQRWIAMEQGRARAEDMARDLQGGFLLSDALKVDFALAFHHFANDTGDKRWNALAEWCLGAVVDKDHGSYYYYPTEAVLHAHALTQEQKNQFLGLRVKWPVDWWIVQLAEAFGVNDEVSREVLQARERRAGRQQILGLGLEAAIILTGLIFAWPLWRFLRRCHPAPRHGDHRRHLRRLWSPALTVLCFSFASGVGFGISALATVAPSVSDWISAKGTAMHWWSFMAVVLGCTIAGALAVPVVMRWFMAPELGSLRQVFDLRWRDFREGRWWFLGIAGSTLIFSLELLLQYAVRWLGLPTHVSDHLSRSFESLGVLALPFGLFWGVMVAPWMEELVCRGFLFTSLKNQFGARWGAAFSSAIFASYHFYGVLGTTQVFIFGMLSCFIYQRTRSLAASMILHGCVNLPLVIIRWLEWSA